MKLRKKKVPLVEAALAVLAVAGAAFAVWWFYLRKKPVVATVGLAADEGTVGGHRLTYVPDPPVEDPMGVRYGL
jgi:hypothetical protein